MQANAESTGEARGGAEASPPAPPRLVSFVAPAHNEVDALPRLLEEIRGVAPRVSDGYEIVIVDDGSSDGTGAWLDRETVAKCTSPLMMY